MSWSISCIGTRNAVRQEVENNTQLPPTVKQLILETIDPKVPYTEDTIPNGLRVDGYGHQYTGPGSHYSNIGSLEITPVKVLV